RTLQLARKQAVKLLKYDSIAMRETGKATVRSQCQDHRAFLHLERGSIMLELLLCSLLTILPDYLFRRYGQGKRLGKEITLYSVWFELRWGITACLILTVSLITTVFYNHPSTSNVTLFFRTVPIVPEINGRVAEVYVGVSGPITKGAPIFRLDSSKQEAAVE